MKALSVGIVALIVFALPAAAARAQTPPFDHLKCYKIKDTRKFAAKEHTVNLVPEQSPPFELEQCVVKMKAKLFCIDVSKTNVDPPPGGSPEPGPQAADYLCYKLTKCNPRVGKDFKIEVTDQFAAGTILIKKAGMLCAPAMKGVPTTTTTTTTISTTTTTSPTTTTTAPSFTCNPETPYPECDGTCPFPLVCQGMGGLCGCQTPASVCEDPQNPFGPPLCWGSCPEGMICSVGMLENCVCVPAP